MISINLIEGNLYYFLSALKIKVYTELQ